MIPVLISLAKNKILQVVSWFKKYYKIIAVIVISILTAILFYQHDQLQKKNLEIDRVTNNYEFYMKQTAESIQQNQVLQLTLNEYKETKDSLIQKIKATQKKLKIKEKELSQVQIQEQEIVHDTTVVVKSNDFEVEIKPNSLTSIIISRKDTLLKHRLDIRNSQTVFVGQKKIYKRQYKNWFQRLLHFDFKKKTIYKYQIDNSNKIIKIENNRIVQL